MKPRSVVALVRHMGWRWVAFRTAYAFRRRSGALRRSTPLQAWPDPTHGRRAISPLMNAPAIIGAGCVAEAEDVLRGRFRIFSDQLVSTGTTPSWHRNCLSGEHVPPACHWSEISDSGGADIKGVWELSRFSWAFPLARAYAREKDERFIEAFWRLFEDWMDANPPNWGPNWMCGQEAAFRLFAATLARDAGYGASASTERRERRFAHFVEATGKRIAANLDYALSQKNNHGVSEAIGLMTCSLYVPDASEAQTWWTLGATALEDQLEELIYEDGSFSQRSAVYHRVLLHDLLWLLALLRKTRRRVPGWLRTKAVAALAFLDGLVNPDTGRTPLYGANDGANILPLADARFTDFRPVIQAGHASLYCARRYAPGPWDEAADWLGAPGWRNASQPLLPLPAVHRTGPDTAENASSPEARVYFAQAGCLVWRAGDLRLFAHCPTRFTHRPSQADLLHVDVEWRGEAIAHDAGTFSYNTPGAFAGSLKEAAVHNTVTFDGAEPMQKVGRFLYLPWPHGGFTWSADGSGFDITHDGWQHLQINHVRSIALSADRITVREHFAGRKKHRARVHWLLADEPYVFEPAKGCLRLETKRGPFTIAWNRGDATLVRADTASNRGWWAQHYGRVEPALSLAIELDFEGAAEVTTDFHPLNSSSASSA